MQHPGYFFFEDAVNDVMTATGQSSVDPSVRDTVHLPNELIFELTTKLNSEALKMTPTTWSKVLCEQTCSVTRSILPWRPSEVAEWEAKCQAELHFNPSDGGKSGASLKAYKEQSVAAFKLLPHAVRKALVDPKLTCPSSSGTWHRNLFPAWTELLENENREVSADRARL